MDQVKIANQSFRLLSKEKELFKHAGTGKELRKFVIELQIIGEEAKDNLFLLIENPFDLEIEYERLRVKKVNSSWSYSTLLNENTIIPIKLHLEELDTDLPEDHDYKMKIYQEVMMNWMRTRAISELLIDKGIISKEEYEDKLKMIIERDAANLADFIAYGIPEPPQE